MKKVISLILALVLTFALSVTAFAEDGTYQDFIPNPQTNEQDVTAAYEAAENTAGTVYYFTIKWVANDTNDLKYTGAKGVYIWNGASMQYSKDAEHSKDAAWTGSAGYKVTVTNQSNSSIYATTTASNDHGLTLTGENWIKKELTTADAGLVANGENGLKIYNVERAGTEVTDFITYTYTANESATAPNYTSESTITVGKITVTVTNTNT